MMVAVCIRLGRPNLVVRLPTPEEKVQRAKKKKGSVWLTPEHPAQSPLTSASYIRYVLTELLGAEQMTGPGRRRSPRHPLTLVHDKDSVHTSQETRAFASRHNIVLIELPARSPDLDPLDFGVFGAVKNSWRAAITRQQLSWEQQCELFIHMLQQASGDAAINGIPGRIGQCIAAAGRHFE